jgi:hypothetical protein
LAISKLALAVGNSGKKKSNKIYNLKICKKKQIWGEKNGNKKYTLPNLVQKPKIVV